MNPDTPDRTRSDRFLTVPNLLSLSRLLLVVPFVIVMLAREPWSRPWAIALLILAALTDKLDGDIARRYGTESEWGRILDPLADKIGIGAGAIVFLVLGLLPLWFVAALLVRDVLIGAGGLYLKHRTGLTLPSLLSGKWSVGLFSLTILLVLVDAPAPAVPIMIGVSCVMLVVSLVQYVRRFLAVVAGGAEGGAGGNS